MNYKIKVNSEAESKEVQGYFEELGAVCCSGLERNKNVNFLFMESGFLTACKLQENFDKSKCKEITLAELRDLVVLKRNDATDCTHWHVTGQANLPYLFAMDEWYFFGRNGWEKSTHTHEFYNRLNPIKKPMKEYLVKNENTGAYDLFRKYPDFYGESDIEIPEGANFAAYNKMMNNFYFDKENVFSPEYLIWQRDNKQTIASAVDSVNDKVASAEDFRQEQKEESFLDEVDMFIDDNVNHPLHYSSGEIECIDAMRAMLGREQFIGYIRGNMFKYQWRYQKKNGIEDLKKSEWYLNKLLEVENEL